MKTKIIATTLILISIIFNQNVLAGGLDFEVENSIAGRDVLINGHSFQLWNNIKFEIEKPNWEILKLYWVSWNNWTIKQNISGYHTKISWKYKVRWESENDWAYNNEFEIFPWKISEIKSTLKISKDSLASNQDVLLVSVIIKDKYWNPIPNHRIKLLSSRFEDNFTEEVNTDNFWKAIFEVISNKEWISTFTAIDTTENKTINTRQKVIFYSPEEKYAKWGSPYWASLINSQQWLVWKYSDDFWPINGFEIETSKEIILNSSENYMIISAIDSGGKIVRNYKWTILITAPEDENAILPWDWIYVFKDEDQWVKRFTLSQTFNKEWKITINVYDYENWKLNEQLKWSKIINAKKDTSNRGSEIKESEVKITSPTNWTKIGSNQITIEWTSLPFINLKVYINEKLHSSSEAESWWDWKFNFTLKWLDDWKNVIYVIEKQWERRSSEEIEIFVDTTPPSIDKTDIFPENWISPEDTFNLNIYSEKNLSSVKVLVDWSIETLREKAWEPWSYEANIIAPTFVGEFPINAILVDTLWNKTTHNNIITLKVVKKISTPPNTITDITATPKWNKIIIKWEIPDSQSEIEEYEIHLWSSRQSIELFWNTAKNDITIENLKENSVYYFSIVAVDKQKQKSGKSTPQMVTTTGIEHGTPISPPVTQAEQLSAQSWDSSVTISWSPLWNLINKYKIKYWLKSWSAQETIMTDWSENSYYIEDLINWLTYNFQVVWLDINLSEITSKTNIVESTPNWIGFIKNWWKIDNISSYVKSKNWQQPKTWSEIWFIAALLLIMLDLTIKKLKNNNNSETLKTSTLTMAKLEKLE